MIQLNRLEGFFWVARTGGYAKAARAFPLRRIPYEPLRAGDADLVVDVALAAAPRPA